MNKLFNEKIYYFTQDAKEVAIMDELFPSKNAILNRNTLNISGDNATIHKSRRIIQGKIYAISIGSLGDTDIFKKKYRKELVAVSVGERFLPAITRVA